MEIKNTKQKAFYSYPEAAAFFGVTKLTIRNWIERGIIKSQIIGVRPKISREEIERILNQ